MRRICTKGGRPARALLLGVFGAACVFACVSVGCGTVLDLDGIDYDVDGAAPPTRLLDGATTPVPGDEAPAADGLADDTFVPPGAEASVPPDGPFTLAQGLGVPQALTIDDTRLYWIATQGAAANGAVQSVLKDGGSLATLATNQPSPLDIAVDGANVYWSVNQGAPAGGASQCLAMLASKDGGAPACAVSGAYASVRMALAGAYLLVLAQAAGNDYVGFASADGGYANILTGGPSLAVAGTSQTLFIANGNGFHVDEFLLPSLGAGPLLCETTCGASAIVDITLDQTGLNLFWITQAAGVFAESLSATTGSAVALATLPSAPQRIARDASYVYVTTMSSVLAVPVTPADAGAQTVTLAAGENHPFGVAVDDARVYWTDADGTIRATNVPAPP